MTINTIVCFFVLVQAETAPDVWRSLQAEIFARNKNAYKHFWLGV